MQFTTTPAGVLSRVMVRSGAGDGGVDMNLQKAVASGQ